MIDKNMIDKNNFEITLPRFDTNDDNATIMEWAIKEFDHVEEKDLLCCVETSKATFEVCTDHAGYIIILEEEGGQVPSGSPIAIVGEDIETLKKEKINYIKSKSILSESDRNLKNKVTKKALALAERHNVNLSEIKKGGFIREKDVLELLDDSHEETIYKETIELKGNKKIGKDLMVFSSNQIPQSYIEKNLDCTNLIEAIDEYISNTNEMLTVLSVIVNSIACSLLKNRLFNSFREDNKIFLYKDINIGVIVHDGKNISIPTIHNADKTEPTEIVKLLMGIRMDLMKKNPNISEISGSTFIISSLEHTDITRFIPIVHPKQAAILALPKIQKQENKHFTNIGLSFDHSFLDATVADKLLVDMENILNVKITDLISADNDKK
jgi:pyruvate/2-oxoglutarate dehydrogenase complex dihydrolipoamide acyltransferase (E2) component